MEDSQEKDYSFLGNDTFPNLYDAPVNERKFKSEYLERQIYERLLKSEPSIVKLSESKSDLSKLSTLSETSIVKFIENQSEHLSKLTLYHLKKRATRRSRRAREPSRIPLLFLRGLNKKNSMLKKFVFKKISTIEIPKSSKLHRYVNKEHRKGRGRGSGRGKTSGRGHKGQGQRNTKPRLGFEGGNTPFYIRVPKHGFKNVYKKIYSPLNLNRLQFFVDSGRINPKEPITMYHLWRSGAIAGRIRDGVTLLGGGTTWFQAKLDIEVSRASKTAIRAIERQGGKITCAHYNKLGLRLLLKPEKFEGRRIPRRARPPRKLMEYYTSVENRGYLADPVELENARLQTYKLENEVD